MCRFSIIVPVYNVEKYIKDCVESLQNQTLKEIEIILVDDGSTDGSKMIIDEYAATDGRIKVLHKINEGVSAARNDGLKLATGEYVIFCDSDDMMEYDACELLYKAGKLHNADVVIGDVYRIINGEKIYAKFWGHEFTTNQREILDELVKVDFSRKYCHDIPPEGPAFGYGGPWNKAVRKEFLDKTGILFDVSLKGIFDDILYTAYIYAEASTVTYIQSPVYDYRILKGSITHRYNEKVIDINTSIFQAWETFLRKYGDKGQYDQAYEVLVVRRIKGTLGTYFFNENNPNSFADQKRMLKGLLKTEPYRTAIKKVNPKKLINRYDLAIWASAKIKSVLGLYASYKLFCILKK